MSVRPAPFDSRAGIPVWLKWTLIVAGIVLILICVYFAYLYHSIQQQKTDGFDKTKAIVLKQTDITDIEDISHFQDDTAYDIALGTTEDHKQQYVFVPKQNEKTDLTTVDTEDTISKQQIINQWKKQCNQCELVRVTPAMIDEKPLWEMTYWIDEDQYIMDYLSIYDGKRYQQFRFKSMFN